MKRLVRWLATSARMLSLIAACGVLGWAARSYISQDSITSTRRYVVNRSDVTLEISADSGAGMLQLEINRRARDWESDELARLYLDGMHRFENEPMNDLQWESTVQEHVHWDVPIEFHWGNESDVSLNSLDANVLGMHNRHCFVQLPLWIIAIPLAAASAVRAIRERRRRRRVRIGHCAECGYDLRETPERCPECGTPAVAAK